MPGPEGGGHPVELSVRQEGVGTDFRMFVPVEAEFADGSSERQRVLIDAEPSLHNLLFRERPRKVVFNPEAAVLAETQRAKR